MASSCVPWLHASCLVYRIYQRSGGAAIPLAFGQQHPGHTSDFVRLGDAGPVRAPSGLDTLEPATPRLWLPINPLDDGPGPVNEEFAQGSLSTLTDP
jgi:hypothetical protein